MKSKFAEMSDILSCKKHRIQRQCMAGESAHPDNWYCPQCDLERENAELRKKLERAEQETVANLPIVGKLSAMLKNNPWPNGGDPYWLLIEVWASDFVRLHTKPPL